MTLMTLMQSMVLRQQQPHTLYATAPQLTTPKEPFLKTYPGLLPVNDGAVMKPCCVALCAAATALLLTDAVAARLLSLALDVAAAVAAACFACCAPLSCHLLLFLP